MHGVGGAGKLAFFIFILSAVLVNAVSAEGDSGSVDLVNGTANQTEIVTETIVTVEPTAEPTLIETILPEETRTTEPTDALTPLPTVTTVDVTPTTEPIPDVIATDTTKPEETGTPEATETVTTVPTETTVVTTFSTELTPETPGTEIIPVQQTILSLTETPTPEPTEGSCSASPSGSGKSYSSTRSRYPLMHPGKTQLDAEKSEYMMLEKYTAPIKPMSLMADGDSVITSKSLLSYLSYIPAERDQGYCGDCWVWASTGALEVEHTVKTGVNERLSVQYFNSKYNNGVGSNWACCGGNIGTFTSWYNSDRTPIPWSNTNAEFGDDETFCGNYATSIPISSITTDPHYTLNTISSSAVATNGSGIDQSTAIANIKSAIDNNKAVYYGFTYGDSGWDDFMYTFWAVQDESAIFDPTPHIGEETAGGHGVLIVGYNMTDRYWLALNSWGTTSGRPNGLFRVKMDIDYNSWFNYTYLGTTNMYYPQHRFYVLDAEFRRDEVGIYRQSTNQYVLRPGDYPATPATIIGWGKYSTDLPVTGDWDGDGITDLGIYRQSANQFILRPSDYPTSPAKKIGWGKYSTDLPVTGDWDGDGITDVGIYRQSANQFVLRPSDYPTSPAIKIGWGKYSTDLPVTGDWDGDGITDVGIYRQSANQFVLRPKDYPATPATKIGWGKYSTDLPVTGDWDGDGITNIGVYRQSTNSFILRPSNWPTTPSTIIGWGKYSTDLPAIGVWF